MPPGPWAPGRPWAALVPGHAPLAACPCCCLRGAPAGACFQRPQQLLLGGLAGVSQRGPPRAAGRREEAPGGQAEDAQGEGACARAATTPRRSCAAASHGPVLTGPCCAPQKPAGEKKTTATKVRRCRLQPGGAARGWRAGAPGRHLRVVPRLTRGRAALRRQPSPRRRPSRRR